MQKRYASSTNCYTKKEGVWECECATRKWRIGEYATVTNTSRLNEGVGCRSVNYWLVV